VLTTDDAEAFARCLTLGGVGLFPADTVYGLACAPDLADAAARLNELKGRPPGKPAAVMFFDRELALLALPELGRRTLAALDRLLPGGVTVLLPNPRRRYPLACQGDPRTLGLRVPLLGEALAPLGVIGWPVLQTSANHAGGPDARLLEDVPEEIRDGVDIVLDGGELAGTPSTIVDLTGFEKRGTWAVKREGAVPREDVERALGPARTR